MKQCKHPNTAGTGRTTPVPALDRTRIQSMPKLELFITVPAELDSFFRAGTHSIKAEITPDEVEVYRHMFEELVPVVMPAAYENADAWQIGRAEILKAAAVEMAALTSPPLAKAE